MRLTSLTRGLGIGLAIVSLGAMVGCSETVLISNPESAPPTRVNAIIEVTSDNPDNPLLVDFGEVIAGEFRDQEVTVKNIGTDTLQLQDFVLSNNASFELLNLDDLVPLLVPRGELGPPRPLPPVPGRDGAGHSHRRLERSGEP